MSERDEKAMWIIKPKTSLAMSERFFGTREQAVRRTDWRRGERLFGPIPEVPRPGATAERRGPIRVIPVNPTPKALAARPARKDPAQ